MNFIEVAKCVQAQLVYQRMVEISGMPLTQSQYGAACMMVAFEQAQQLLRFPDVKPPAPLPTSGNLHVRKEARL